MADNSEGSGPKRPKMDDRVPAWCEYNCGREFGEKPGSNKSNYDLHLKACPKQPELKQKKKIFNYFKRSSSSDTAINSNNRGATESTTAACSTVDIDENENCDVSVYFVEDHNEQPSVVVSEAKPRPQCQGKEFWVDSSPSFYRNYPFHRHFISSGNENYNLSYRINIVYDPNVGENKMIVHSSYCKDELIDEVGTKDGCNKMCSDVVDTKAFKNMLKLSTNISNDPNTPTELLTYEQLQCNYRELRGKLDKRNWRT